MTATATVLVNASALTIKSIAPVNVRTTTGTAPTLPYTVTAIMSDGTTQNAAVNWTYIAPSQYANDGTFTLTGTITNFAARLLLCASFVVLVVALPLAYATEAAIIWGVALLATLTYLVARERNVRPLPEVIKHLMVAAAAIIVSSGIGHGIGALLR